MCYVTRDGMYRHDSGQQILLVKSMRGGDETDVTKALSGSWCRGRSEPSRPSWRFKAAKVHFLPSKPCKVKWTGWIVGIMSSTGGKKGKKEMRLAVSSAALSNFLWFYCQEHQSFCSNVALPLDASICCLQRVKAKNSVQLILIPAQRLSVGNFAAGPEVHQHAAEAELGFTFFLLTQRCKIWSDFSFLDW